MKIVLKKRKTQIIEKETERCKTIYYLEELFGRNLQLKRKSSKTRVKNFGQHIRNYIHRDLKQETLNNCHF